MLKVTAPWVRETPVKVAGPDGDQRHIVVRVDPPGAAISLRLRRSKLSYSIPIWDLWHIVTSGEYKQVGVKAKPKEIAQPDIPHEITMVLASHKDPVHFATIQSQLKAKGLGLDKRTAATILDLMKQTGKVKQEGFAYSLTRK